MSAPEPGSAGSEPGALSRWRGRLRALGRAVVGDRIGLCLLLATLLVVSLYWRVGVFITDNYTLYNALAAAADGHLWVDAAPVGGSLNTPGMHSVGSLAYARNYGEVLLAVPVLWAVRGLAAVADLHVALVALWHAVALALVVQVAALRRWPQNVVVGASVLAVVSFVLNLSLARSLSDVAPVVVSLQFVTVGAAALTAVLTYRLVGRHRSTRTAVAAGAAVALATPIGFWAPIPKRHVLTGLVVVGVLYAFDRSRSPEAGRLTLPLVGPVPAFRAGAYALVGLYAWVHAAEALFLLVPLALVDLPTAPRNDGRALATVAVGFALSVVPLVLTNVLISGDPLSVPRTLPNFDPDQFGGSTGGGGGSAGGGGSGEDLFGGGGGGGRGPLWLLQTMVDHYRMGVEDLLGDFEGLRETLVATDNLADLHGSVRFRAANLALLESAPLLGALVALPVAAVVGLSARGRSALDGFRATDALAVLMTVSLLLLYLPRLPLHVQVTARYVLPLFPLAVYGIARLGVVQRVLESAGGLGLRSYVAGVGLGAPLVLAVALDQGLSVGESVQFHGAVNLALAAAVAVALSASVVDDRFDPLAALALGLAAAGGTVFVLLSGLVYFSFVGPYLLPVVRVLSDAVVVV
jgi:hypothetical protein